MAWRKSIQSLVLWVVWLATRTALYWHATAPGRDGDVGLYQAWYTCCFSRHAAGGRSEVAVSAGRGPGLLAAWRGCRAATWTNFMVLAIGCDLAITLMLACRARRGGSLAGAWYWVCGVPLLGPVIVGRFDMVPVTLSVAAAVRRPAGAASAVP